MISTPPILDDAGPRSRRLISVSLAEAIHCPRMSFVLGARGCSSCLGLMPSTSEDELAPLSDSPQFLVRLGQPVNFHQGHSGNVATTGYNRGVSARRERFEHG